MTGGVEPNFFWCPFDFQIRAPRRQRGGYGPASTARVEEVALGEPGGLLGLVPIERRRRIGIEDSPNEDRVRRRDRRRNPLPPGGREPGGRPDPRISNLKSRTLPFFSRLQQMAGRAHFA